MSQCECLKQRIQVRRILDLPERFRECGFDNYTPVGEMDMMALRIIQANPMQNFYLWGQYGRGKTHLAAAQYRALVDAGQPCVWRSMWDLIRELRDADVRDITSQVLQGVRYSDSFHLFIDDLDKFKTTEYRDETLFDVFDTVYRRKLGLTITSNYGLVAIGETDKLSPAILRRIDDMCQSVEV